MRTNSIIFKTVHILFWIVFIGLCIKAGAILISFIISLFVNAAGAQDLYLGLDLSELYVAKKPYYIVIVLLLIALTALKALITYFAVKFFLKLNLIKPFSKEFASLFIKISYISLGTGVLATIANEFSSWISGQGINIPIYWAGNEILFFAGIIYLLALIFKKGIEIQSENDLTI
ncbi:MAG TPA: DUF2975 domain-containing protein [Flavobacterium sp.]|nr:DUF2975 domain-containing protein [Flavobacterium sp.]